jgi:hypothetical protein
MSFELKIRNLFVLFLVILEMKGGEILNYPHSELFLLITTKKKKKKGFSFKGKKINIYYKNGN